MKRFIATILAVMMLLGLTACGSRNDTGMSGNAITDNENLEPEVPDDDFSESEDIPNQELDLEWEAEQDQKYEMEQYGLDLSMYDTHGEWNYDRMWVHKIEESWDAVKGYYGYIDRKGNLVGKWHEETSDNDIFDDDGFISCEMELAPWKVPGDFQGEYAVVLSSGSGSSVSTAYVEVIDLQGNSVGRFAPDFFLYTYRSDELMVNDFAKKLCNDKLFWEPDTVRVCMSWIENGEFCVKDIDDSLIFSAFEILPKTNGYYPYIRSYDKESRIGLISDTGDHVFTYKMDYEVTKLIPSVNEKTVNIHFIGADNRKYEVVMDFDGNWISDPKRID